MDFDFKAVEERVLAKINADHGIPPGRKNALWIAAAKSIGVTEIGGHPIDSVEADLFLDENREARKNLKSAVFGLMYGGGEFKVLGTLTGRSPR